MKIIIQKVHSANITYELNGTYSYFSIQKGIILFVQFNLNDSNQNLDKIISNLLNLKLYPGDK